MNELDNAALFDLPETLEPRLTTRKRYAADNFMKTH